MGLRRLAAIADNLILAGRRVDEGARSSRVCHSATRASAPARSGRSPAGRRACSTPSVVIVGDVALHPDRLRSLAATTLVD